MCNIDPEGLPILPATIDTLAIQLFSIRKPDNKIRTLVGNIIFLIQNKI